MESRLGCTRRDPEHRCDPGQGLIEIEVEHDNGTSLGIETSQVPIEQVAFGDLRGRILRDRIVERSQLDLDDPPPAPAKEIEAGVRDEAVQPVVEARRIAQPRQAAPRPDQGLLDGVLGKIRVAKDEASGGVQARTGRAHELSKGVPVALPRSKHESVLVHHRLSGAGATIVAVLDSLRRPHGRKRFHLPERQPETKSLPGRPVRRGTGRPTREHP